jgi:hypothetical protein
MRRSAISESDAKLSVYFNARGYCSARKERALDAIDQLNRPGQFENAAAMTPARGSLLRRHWTRCGAAIGFEAAVIMPAATVLLVSASIRMNAPVERFSP